MTLPLSLLVAHFIGDFLLQSDWMATQKSKQNAVLTLHALVYSLCFFPLGWKFWLLTFYSHWATDWVTSRLTSRLWFVKRTTAGECWRTLEPETPALPGVHQLQKAYWVDYLPSRHWFFVTIGADQLIHMATLAATLWLLS